MNIILTLISLLLSAVCLVYTSYTNLEPLQILVENGIGGDFHPKIVIHRHLTYQFFMSMGALAFAFFAVLRKQPLARTAVIFAFVSWVLVFLPVWSILIIKNT